MSVTYIKDLFDLPDYVQRGDFVLRLTEGITKPEETVKNYVVTPQLVDSFNQALNLVSSALASNSSRAAYLHGSFGSGKSHFMAILNLILQGNSDARSISELAAVIAKHNQWSEGKRFLLVPYHFVDAKDMESALLGGYASWVRRTHPEAPTPGVYLADSIFTDAENLRKRMGDAAFFEQLNERTGGAADGGGWGEIGTGWSVETFRDAVSAPANSDERTRLVGDLVETYFSSARSASEYVDLDTGLSIISKHARALGYDVLILFLDELILWLGSRAADTNFLQREGQKLAKLVEAQLSERPAPVVSFIARQRDLRDFVSDNVMGVQIASFTNVLNYWEARFSKITLEDRNLPVIAEKRVLKPKSEAARVQLDEAFRQTERIREEVMNVLLTSHADRSTFRKVYPFSPALVDTLVAVSSLLQRERTALKVMMQLLVEQKNTLALGEIIPVGDLFDVISEGDEAFSDVMKKRFDDAKKLYESKLKPMLEAEHNLSFADAKSLSAADLKAISLKNDDRLIKTLLLSALADNVESLRNLTAEKLAALNHGTVRSPLAGREAATVLSKLRNWASKVGEIKIGEDPVTNPPISLQITGIDTESILEQAQTEDNAGNRRRKIRELVLDQLGVEQQDQLFQIYDFTWRATKRDCEIVFGNIRDKDELPDNSFQTDGGNRWRVIVDFPFDTAGHSPSDDLSRLIAFKQNKAASALVIAWIPSFLSKQIQKDLGTLVRLDHVLNNQRFTDFVIHLPPAERNAAKTLLENQQRQLKQKLIGCLEMCYGIANEQPGMIDSTYQLDAAQHFQTLANGLSLQIPSASTLKEAFDQLLDQALKFQYPAHPPFEPDAKLNAPSLTRVFETIEKAVNNAENRVLVDQIQRKEVRLIANPLKLGEMHEQYFLAGRHWVNLFNRKEAEFRASEGNEKAAITVGRLRQWIESDSPMGLPKDVQNLVIMSFAAQTNRTFSLYGGFNNPTVTNLADNWELREQSLPASVEWETAKHRASEIFDLNANQNLNVSNVAKLASDLKQNIGASVQKNNSLLQTLIRKAAGSVPASQPDFPRLKTAEVTQNLLASIEENDGKELIEAFAKIDLEGVNPAAVKSSLQKAAEVENRLNFFNFELIAGLSRISDERAPVAALVQERLQNALLQDEYVIPLASSLNEIERDATRLLTDQPKSAQTIAPTAAAQAPNQPTAKFVAPELTLEDEQNKAIARGSKTCESVDELTALTDEIKKSLAENVGAIEIRVQWEIFRK